TAVKNPYAIMTDIEVHGDRVSVRIDGTEKQVDVAVMLEGIRLLRRAIYAGDDPQDTESRTPWSSDVAASPTRVLKNHFVTHPEITPLDWLYMFERAIER